MAIVAQVGEWLAGYLALLGLATSSGTARLVAGQFHDMVLAGEVAYRFPRDEQSRAKLTGRPLRQIRSRVIGTLVPRAVPDHWAGLRRPGPARPIPADVEVRVPG